MSLHAGYHDVPPGHIAAVVTHLEMTAAAPLRGATLPEGVTFEPLARDPGPYRDVFRRVGRDWLWFSRLSVPDAGLETLLADARIELFTLISDGRPEALLELDFRTPDACELAYFGLTEALIGMGVGAYLMDRAIELAWSQDINCLHVHTCTLDSPSALRFYERSGFVARRRQIEVAPDPRTSGLLAITDAPAIPII